MIKTSNDHEDVNAVLKHRFRYAITFIKSLIFGGIILTIPVFSELLYETVLDLDLIYFAILSIFLGSAAFASLITSLHFLLDRRRSNALKKRPLKNLIVSGYQVIDENVVGTHNGYSLNIARVSHIKKLNSGAYVIRIYYQPDQFLTDLKKSYSFKISEWANIKFYNSYLEFYFTKVLFTNSYGTLIQELDRVTAILANNHIKATELENTEVKHIANSDFDEVLESIHVDY